MGRRGRPIDQYASLEFDMARGLGVVLHLLQATDLADDEKSQLLAWKQILEDGLARVAALRRG
jgi:hypothetical protein